MAQEHAFFGVHVFGEMYGIDRALLNDAERLQDAMRRGIEKSGATLCSMQVKVFDPEGVTALALLSESHASIHTYPERGALFFDAFTCGDTCRPQAIAEALMEFLRPTRCDLKELYRGEGCDKSVRSVAGAVASRPYAQPLRALSL